MNNEADGLRETLESTYPIRLDPEGFRADFARALRRSYTTDAEEFAALVFAEVWSGGTEQWEPDHRAVLRRVFDRVQHRLSREVRRHRGTERLPDDAGEAAQPSVPEIAQQRELVRTVSAFLDTLSPRDALLFDEVMVKGEPVEAFVMMTGISRTSVYRTRVELQRRFRAFLDRRRE